MRIRLLSLLVVALVLVPAGSAVAKSRTETATFGDVTAALTYDYRTTRYGGYDFTHMHVTVTRAGVMLVDSAIGKECSYCTPWPASMGSKDANSVTVRDLDGDGEPEVLVDLYSGGANCCWYTNSYRFDADQNKYIFKVLRPGLSFPYVLKDLNGDGLPEFRSEDYRFAYKYGSNADTPRPLRIFQWDAGKLVDVTLAYPQLAAKEAASLYKGYLHFRKVKYANVRGLLAAYLADSYNARHAASAWRRVVAAYHRGDVDRKIKGDIGPFGAQYLNSLRRFLTKLGYLRTP